MKTRIICAETSFSELVLPQIKKIDWMSIAVEQNSTFTASKTH